MEAGDSMPATDTVFCGRGWCIGSWPCQFSRNVGFCGRGYGGCTAPLVGDIIDGPLGILGPPGGRRTTGRLGSTKPPLRDMIDPAGDTRLSRPISRAIDERLLIATLGEYTLPPYALVRLLEKPPPKDPNRPRPRPKPCWLGRRALGMKMNERSVVGKMYRGGAGGNDIRTGLSRRRGGRWFGRRVCCFMGTFWKCIGFFMLGKNTRTMALWVCTVVEKLRACGDFWAGPGGTLEAKDGAFGAC